MQDVLERLHELSGGGGLQGLEQLLEAALEGIVVCDAEGRVCAANSRAYRLLGATRSQLEGCPLLGVDCAAVDEDGGALCLHNSLVMQAIGTAGAVCAVVGVIRPGSDMVWLRTNASPVRNESGTIRAVILSLIDITPLKRAEAALRASEAHSRVLAQAVAQSNAAMVITDLDGCIEYVNPACCRAYGYAEVELIGQNCRIFKSGETAQEAYAALWHTLTAGQAWRGELSNRTRDGRLIREKVSISPVRDNDGAVYRYVAVKEDITAWREDERRRHELFERVARLERMELVATLSSGIAHDFNNILVAILGYSEIAGVALKADGRLPRVDEYVKEINIAGERARELVQQLLNFSRSGAAHPALTHVDDVVREVSALLRATLPESVALLTEVDAGLPTLSVDPAHLYQILMNLLINARDAVSGSGTISLSVDRVVVERAQSCASCKRSFSGEFLRFVVSDNGAGIEPQVRSKMFEPFFTTKDIGRGTGMGLPVVHGMTHLYEGHVQVESVPGAGARVAVLLPVSRVPA